MPAGRPTQWRDEFVEDARNACEAGATDYELALLFGVTRDTVNEWRVTRPEFAAVLKAGKTTADDRVERSLFERATGYSFESERVFQFQGKIVRATVVEHVPPDPGAAKNWLTNRRPDVWRERKEVDLTVRVEESLDSLLLEAEARENLKLLVAEMRDASEVIDGEFEAR